MTPYRKHKAAALLLLVVTLSWQASVALMPCLCKDSSESPATIGTSCDVNCICGDSSEATHTDIPGGLQDCSTDSHNDSDLVDGLTVPSSNHSHSHNIFGCIHTGERINTGAVSETTISTLDKQTSEELTQLESLASIDLSQYEFVGNFNTPIVLPPALHARTLPLLI